MDINDLRIAVTVVSLATFLGLMAWVWAARNRQHFEEAAQLPFADKDGSP